MTRPHLFLEVNNKCVDSTCHIISIAKEGSPGAIASISLLLCKIYMTCLYCCPKEVWSGQPAGLWAGPTQ